MITNNNIQIANLPEEDAPCPPKKSLILSGWGRDVYNLSRSLDKLWAVKQQCLNVTEECTLFEGDPSLVLCMGDKEQTLNSGCNGDSGGIFILIIHSTILENSFIN